MPARPLIETPVPAQDVKRGDGPLVSEFTEKFCRLTKDGLAARAGTLIQLRPWQQGIIGKVYARRDDGRLRHREALIGLPRKNSKSAIGSSLGVYGLLMSGEGAEVYCLDPGTRVLCLDMRWRRCGELATGDGIVGFDEEPSLGCVRRFRPAAVTSVSRIVQPCHRITFEDGRSVIASAAHRWVTRPYPSSNLQRWATTADLRPGARVHDLGKPWEFDDSREGGYLAGLLDGEACLIGAGSNGGTYRRGAVLNFAQNPGAVLDRFERGMKERGFGLAPVSGGKTCEQRNIRGVREVFRALGTLGPSRLLAKVPRWIDGMATNRLSWARVASVENLGLREVVAMGTTTKTLIAEGFFSHNSCAADKDQAKIVFSVAKKMVEKDQHLSELINCYRDVLEVPQTGSIYKALSSEAFSKEGLNASLVLYDELHAAPNDELYYVMSLGSGTRRDPLLIAITTAGSKYDTTGQESICYRRYQYGKKVATGEVTDPSFYMCWYGAPENSDYRDESVWAAANPAYGDFLDPDDFRAAIGRVHENEFRTKRLNQWVNTAQAWLPAGAWAGCRHDGEFVQPGRGVVLGFDGSQNGDCTALVAVTVESEPKVKVLGLWEKPQDHEDWRVPRAEVKDAIRQACRDYDVREIAADEYRWADAMEELEGEGLPVVTFPQNLSRMAPATQRFYEMVTTRKIRHDGDPRLARHLDNAQLRIDSRGARLQKDARNSPRKIDLGVAAVMAVDRAAYWLNQAGPDMWTDSKGNTHRVSGLQFVW